MKIKFLTRIGFPTTIIVILAVFLFHMIQPLAKPVMKAIESIAVQAQVAHTAAPGVQLGVKPVGSGQAVVPKGPSTTWTSIHVIGNPPKNKCQIHSVFFVFGERFNLSRYLDEECTAENVGNALKEYIKDIKKALKFIKNPDPQIMKDALDGLEAFEKLLIERGIRILPLTP